MATNAKLNIDIVVQSRKRLDDEPFRPTEIVNSDFHVETDLDNYPTLVETIADKVWDYISEQRALGWENSAAISIRLDNATHTPNIGAGVVPLAKGHRDAALTGEEITSAAVIRDFVQGIILDLKHRSKY